MTYIEILNYDFVKNRDPLLTDNNFKGAFLCHFYKIKAVIQQERLSRSYQQVHKASLDLP